jgi:D-glycero-D-manno-heptose 1,7-bisphosphate phosphatase
MLGKGPDRPLNLADDRVYVLSGMAAVDLLTIFDEPTPVELIRSIRPDIYVKGGDYNMDTLEESQLVRSWGGKSLAIPFVNGFSTTKLVNRIRHKHFSNQKAAFLDRDGVINIDKGYVHQWDDFEFVTGAIEGMRKLQDAGYKLVIVTNQSGLARGYYTEAEYLALNKILQKHLFEQGVNLAGIFHCPHHQDGTVKSLAMICNCRKPKPGLLFQAANALELDMPNSLLIGDKPTDIEAARAAGVGRAYIVDSNYIDTMVETSKSDGRFANLLECANHVLESTMVSNK